MNYVKIDATRAHRAPLTSTTWFFLFKFIQIYIHVLFPLFTITGKPTIPSTNHQFSIKSLRLFILIAYMYLHISIHHRSPITTRQSRAYILLFPLCLPQLTCRTLEELPKMLSSFWLCKVGESVTDSKYSYYFTLYSCHHLLLYFTL